MSALPSNISRFEIAIGGLSSEIRVLRFTGTEEMSRPFVFDVEIASEDDSIAFDQVVDQAAVLGILRDGETRYVNGIVTRFEQGEVGLRFALYRVQIMPKIQRLAYRHNCRIFQEKSAPDIIKQILDDLGLGGDEYRQTLQGNHPTREYCVQYRESELDFIQRLMEEEGTFYYFEHQDDKHVMVMADSSSIHKDVTDGGTLLYAPRSAGRITDEHVFDFRYSEQIRPGLALLRDFNFKRPDQDLDGTNNSNADAKLEYYDYPGIYDEAQVGSSLAQVRLEGLRVPRKLASGASVCSNMIPGFAFTLDGFPRDDFNHKYLITSLTTTGAQPQALEETAGSGGSEFSNTFVCIPFDVPYRAPRRTPKPFVQGAQTAIVVGPSGEEIYTDEFGRIKVQFHWDREGQGDEKASCWIRTSQAWAGAGWGSVCIPRIGHEVIVDFLEGDPDRPIVTGRVYHGTNRPPYALPDKKTMTAFKSNSSKGGSGFNEIRLEDKKGEEQIFVHAERNQDVRVKHDALEWIGNNRHLIVKKDQLEQVDENKHLIVKKDKVEKIQGDLHETVKGDRFQKLDGDQHLKVAGDRKEAITGENNLKVTGNQSLETSQSLSEKAGMNAYLKAGMNIGLDGGMGVHIKAGMNLVLEGGLNVTLKCGGSSIALTPAGIFIAGAPLVNINTGSAAVGGDGCSPKAPASPSAPKEPDEAQVAANDLYGKIAKAKKAERPPTPKKYGAQAVTLKAAHTSGAAVCKECEAAAAARRGQGGSSGGGGAGSGGGGPSAGGAGAGGAAQSTGAAAFTQGDGIQFPNNNASPLAAHEVAHTTQQSGDQRGGQPPEGRGSGGGRGGR
jgi:type VI secretion system secreted protein VgrG